VERLERILDRAGVDQLRVARKIVVAVIGTTIVLIGLALIILPGPAFVVIPVGLGILATEFVWARRVIRRGRVFAKKVGRSVKEKVG
jgi:tellurite resistance protein TerC